MGVFARSLVVGTLIVGLGGSFVPVLAGSGEEQLPFLADEAPFPPGIAPRLIWPERVGFLNEPARDPSTRPIDLPPAPPAYPDLTALLAPLTGQVTIENGIVHIAERAEHAARATRLLAATRAAYARDLHIEVEVHRGDEKLLSMRRATRAGALLLDDDRSDSVWPAAKDSGPLLVIPESIAVRTGARVSAIVEVLPGGRMIVNLDLHLSRVRGERVFDDQALRRVAPEIEVSHLRGALPVPDSGTATATLGPLRIDVRVRHDRASVVSGTRWLSLPRPIPALPDAVHARPRRLPLVFERDLAWDTMPGDASLPESWMQKARGLGVRLVAVPPARAIGEGDEAALDLLIAALSEQPRIDARMVRDSRDSLSAPVVVGRSFTILDAVLIPVATTSDTDVQSGRAAIATQLHFEAVGRSAHGVWDGAVLVLTSDRRTSRAIPGTTVTPRSNEGGGAPTEIAIDAVNLASESRTTRLTDDADQAATLAPLEDWR